MTLSKNVAPAEDHRFLIYPRQLRSPILKVTELLSVAGATASLSATATGKQGGLPCSPPPPPVNGQITTIRC